jgi:hypothetical protein
MKKILILLFAFLSLISCKTTKYSPVNYKDQQLVVGSSGGVTGTIKEYALLDNGQLYVNKGISGEWKYLRKVKGAKVRYIFNKVEELGLDTMKFKHPGNMSYYLVIKTSKKSNEVKWGEAGKPVPAGINAFYQELIKAL